MTEETMTDPQWILHGPGKHDRAVCDTAETWARLFSYAVVGLSQYSMPDAEKFVARNKETAARAADLLPDNAVNMAFRSMINAARSEHA